MLTEEQYISNKDGFISRITVEIVHPCVMDFAQKINKKLTYILQINKTDFFFIPVVKIYFQNSRRCFKSIIMHNHIYVKYQLICKSNYVL